MSMNPTRTNLRVDVPLTNMAIGYKNVNFIADDLFPIFPVQARSGIVPSYAKSHWFRDAAHKRAPGTPSKGSGFKTDLSATFYCHRYSFRFEYDDDTLGEVMAPFNLDRDGVMFVTDKLQLRREVAWATDFFVTSVWDTNTTLSGSDQWDDVTSDPLGKVEDNKDTVEGLTAQDPNVAIMGRQVWRKLKWHPDLIDTIKYTQKGQMTVDLAASLFELDRLVIGKGIYTTDVEGVAEASVSYSRIWGKNFLLLNVPTSVSVMTAAAGLTFVWQRVAGALQWMKRMRNEEKEITIIEGNSYFDQKTTATDSGALLLSVVS